MDHQIRVRRSDLESMLLDESIQPRDLPLPLLEDITGGFSCDQEIGRGGFAVVYKGTLTNGAVAVKKLINTHIHETKFQQEVGCLMKAKHKNVVRFLGYCADTQGKMANYNGKFVMADVQQRLLCFEYLPRSLDVYITDASNRLEWTKLYQIIKGICKGLHYLHENKIVHLDIKPSNILLDDNIVPKIADFGLSRCFDENQSRAVTSKLIGSMGYMAPEFYSGEITFKSDIYSLGVIITEILTGKKGYAEIDNVLESWRNMVGISQGNKELEQIRVCAEIGLECIDSNPRRRPTTEHILDQLYQMESTNLSTETSENSTSVMNQPECYISEGCHPSASRAKKPNDEPSVKQKRDSKCQQESVNNNQCSGYYTWQEIKTEKGDNYFNASFHDDQTSKNLEYFVVVDFKATCEKGKQINPQEIIEFSSVLVDGSTGQLESTFHTYVRPMQHPKLTDFCRDLNGIRQKDVDAGVELAVVLRMHGEWLQKMGTKKCSGFRFVVVTWGNWDCRSMLESECRFKGIDRPPYFDRWINLRIPYMAALGGSKLGADLADAIRIAGLEWEGRPRGASDDACNTARLLGELLRRGVQLGITSSLALTPTLQLL
ncbi:cysteine-rich receptor-like protein kinase 8 [Miscanthus floridulus]|uniref:cysteine-rich receptor-like protein kinase 8 n=1 Tax=Miscanthus floridulus TaxID=154761 RepID=UPI00345B2243